MQKPHVEPHNQVARPDLIPWAFELQRHVRWPAWLDLHHRVNTCKDLDPAGLIDRILVLDIPDQTVTRLRQSRYRVQYRARQAVNMLAKANFRIAKHIEHDM